MNRLTTQFNQGMGTPREIVLLLLRPSHLFILLFRECEGVQTAKPQKVVFLKDAAFVSEILIIFQL
jgi:hypothetical protein